MLQRPGHDRQGAEALQRQDKHLSKEDTESRQPSCTYWLSLPCCCCCWRSRHRLCSFHSSASISGAGPGLALGHGEHLTTHGLQERHTPSYPLAFTHAQLPTSAGDAFGCSPPAATRDCCKSSGAPLLVLQDMRGMRWQPLALHRGPSVLTCMLLPVSGVMEGALPYKACLFLHKAMTVA